MKPITIAVSGINAVDNPGPGMGIMRSLKESNLNVRTIGLAYDNLEPGIYLNQWNDKSYILPYPSGERDSFLRRIQYIHSKENLDVIISALDAELPMYMSIQKDLEELGIKMMIPTKEMFNLRNKTALNQIAEKVGIKIPEYIVCTSYSDLIAATNSVGFPCMIKGPFYEAFKANNLMEAEEYFNKIANKWGYPIIVQSFIVGEEFDVIAFGDGLGDDLGVFAIRKMTTTQLGKVWNAISIHNPKLIDATKRIIRYLKWQGGMEFEAMMETKTGEIYLLEINPRFPAWVYFASACGINLPERMVKLLLGMDYEKHSDYSSGKLMIRYTAEIVKDINEFEKITTYGELENNKKQGE